jgi:hypothetical protein
VRTPHLFWAATSAIGIGACSIFSGWGDLQGGSRKPSTDAGATDDHEIPSEAALAERAWPYPCTPQSCGGDACCVNLAAPGQADCESPCASSTQVGVRCRDDHDCASSPKGKICCVFPIDVTGSTWNQVDCASSCNGEVACDPGDPSACTGGKLCQPSVYQVLYTCK